MKKGNAKQIEERKAAIERDLEEVKQKINDKNQKLISVEKSYSISKKNWIQCLLT